MPERPDDKNPIGQTRLDDEPKPAKRRHWASAWIRVPLRIIAALIVFVLLIPVLVYLPPVQDVLTRIACDIATEKTGMKVEVGRFRLKWPLNVALDDVRVIQLSGDTMVDARTAIADVKIRPLFDLDVRLNGLRLVDGYYRMQSEDSSMLMKIKAGLLDVDGKSAFDIKNMRLALNRARLRDGSVDLYMDVWKKKPTPADSVDSVSAKPFFIEARDLRLQNFTFAMSMLPTIDTLRFNTEDLRLRDGVVDLGKNEIRAGALIADNGAFTYLTPTPEYIKTHPAPIDTISPPSPPMTIMGDSVALNNFKVLYAVKGARPMPGFDASYIDVSDLSVSLRDLYNQESTVRLPITRLLARERCGLQLTDGRGLVAIDSLGLSLQGMNLRTTASQLSATAMLPFAAMEMRPDAKMSVEASGDVGFYDIEAFMPSLKPTLAMLSPARRASLALDAVGSISDLAVKKLRLDVPGILSLAAAGRAAGVTTPDRMKADLKFDASLRSPAVVRNFVDLKDINIPAFSIVGSASIDWQNYAADFTMNSSAGDLVADGRVSMTAESYQADVDVRSLNVGHIMPSLGLGVVDGRLTAKGNGFDPTARGAATDIVLNLNRLDYGKHSYKAIKGNVGVHAGRFDVDLVSADPEANLALKGSGALATDFYDVDLHARIDNLNLQALGFSPDVCHGNGDIYVKGTASPERWLYDMELDIQSLNWTLPDQEIYVPAGVQARLVSTATSVDAQLFSDGISFAFSGEAGIPRFMTAFSKAMACAEKQIKERNIDVTDFQNMLPSFSLDLDGRGDGVIAELLKSSGMKLDNVDFHLQNVDSLISGNAKVLGFTTDSNMRLDTIKLDLSSRGTLLDYALHVGNTPANQPELADVNMNGYVGGNRASAFLTQRNNKGETGYRLGFTAAMADSVVSLHFTPLKATIGYRPWTLNADNYIDYDFDRRVNANLMATGIGSSILVKTEPADDGLDQLHVNLTNINIEDFLAADLTGASPIKANVNSDIVLQYRGTALTGHGSTDIRGLEYNNTKIGDFAALFDADLDFKGDTQARASLQINGQDALVVKGLIRGGDTADPNDFSVDLTSFPLSVANAFLPKDMAQLEGALDGNLSMAGSFDEPLLNGDLQFSDVAVFIPMMGSRLHFGKTPVTMRENVVTFDDFQVQGQNANPLVLNGTVDARKFSNVLVDLALNANNFQLVNNSKKDRSQIYGKLFLNLNATAKGPVNLLDINGNLSVLNTTDVAYNFSTTQAQLQAQQNTDVVKFVNFSDTTQIVRADTIEAAGSLRIQAGVTIQPGTKVTVNLQNNGTDKVVVNPSGTLNYFQNFMGDMRLNGQLLLGEGYGRYTLPVVGEKMFTLEPGCFVQWNGSIMNPTLNLVATDQMKVNVTQNGNSRLVNFLVYLDVSNTLEQPKVSFDLDADGDVTIENELQAMTPEQRSNQAMNLLLYGQYTGPNTKTSTGNLGESMLYGLLTSQLNSWAAKTIKGVDLSFGINQYDKTVDGRTSNTMSYSYQVSKSLLNNRFKIVVGGNYSTDASTDDNFAENLLSDVSFEYMLKQTNNLSMLVKLFRQYNYESVLEGEVTETGVGFVMKRRMSDLKRFFRVRWGKRKNSVPADSTKNSK